jgi:hypothetical protein
VDSSVYKLVFGVKNVYFIVGFPKAQKGGRAHEYPQAPAKTLSRIYGSLLGKLQRRLKFK